MIPIRYTVVNNCSTLFPKPLEKYDINVETYSDFNKGLFQFCPFLFILLITLKTED